MLSGMALFLKTYDTELDNAAFVKRLSAVDPEEIIRRGKLDFSTSSIALRYARVLLEKYNSQREGKNCRTASIPDMEDSMEQHIYTQEEMEAMKNVDIRTVDIDTLRDIRDVTVNTDLPKEERILDFIRQIGNPYCYRHGKYVVKISFTDTNVTLEQRMLSYLRSKY